MKTISYVGIFFVAFLGTTDAQITGWASPVIATDSGASTASITVAEDAATSTKVYTFVATPTSPDTIASYELLTSNIPFEISSPGGVLTVSAPLDYETTPSYVIKVKVTDNAGTPHVGTATVTITVTDVNYAPVFEKTSYTVCVADKTTADKTVTTFSATDADTGDTITYSIYTGNTNTDFKVSTDELQVNTGKTLDMETTSTYTIVIHATDDDTTAKTGSATYTINVKSSCKNRATALTVTFFTIILTLIVSLN